MPQPPRQSRYVEEEVFTPPPRRPLLWPWLVLLLLLVITGVVAAYLLTRDDSGSETKVPNVVGLNTAIAVRELGQRGYAAAVRTQLSTSARPGNVIAQAPAPGTELDKGGRVTIIAASRAKAHEVPNLVGLSVAAAFKRLQEVGLKGATVKVRSERPKDEVLRQLPPPGTNVKQGTTVAMVLSKGRSGTPPPPTTTTTTTTTTGTTTAAAPGPPRKGGGKGSVAVPNVIGKGQQAALATLLGKGLHYESFPVSSSRPRGIVLSQAPKAGSKVAPKTPVRVGVSLGPGTRPLRVVPDLTGMTEADAQRTLIGVGFTVRTVSRGASKASEDGIVLDQDPAAGSRASAGSQIVIIVGRIPSASS